MINKRTASVVSLGLLGIPLYALNFRLQGILVRKGILGSGTEFFSFFLYQYIILGALYLAALCIVFRRDPAKTSSPHLLYIIIFVGFAYRLCLLPTHPMLSSDMYRYIWDGRVQSHGINPYRYPPNHEALAGLRDDAVYKHMNRKASPTIYPAGAQVLFWTLNRVGLRGVISFKGSSIFFDIASILLLVAILGNMGLNRERVVAYAWNPLVVYELANNGHLDGFVIFFFLLSLWLLMKGRHYAFVSSLALAAALKLYPLIVLPALLREKKVRSILLFCAIFSLLYVPYLSVGKGVIGFLPEYLTNPYETFNLGLKAYIMGVIPSLSHALVSAAFAGALLVAVGAVWFKKKTDAVHSLELVYLLAGLQLLLTTASLHPWYVLWMIPFMCFFPSPAWLYLSLAVPLSYLQYSGLETVLPGWALHLEYIPFLILLAVEYVLLRWVSGVSFPLRLAEVRSGGLEEVAIR